MSDYKSITTDELYEKSKSLADNEKVLDVRGADEFEAGHLDGAKHVLRYLKSTMERGIMFCESEKDSRDLERKNIEQAMWSSKTQTMNQKPSTVEEGRLPSDELLEEINNQRPKLWP